MQIELPEPDWRTAIAILSRAPYAEVAPIIAAIAGQMAQHDVHAASQAEAKARAQRITGGIRSVPFMTPSEEFIT